MSMSLNDLNSIFQTGQDVCAGAAQITNTVQNVWDNVQNNQNNRRAMWGAQPQQPLQFAQQPTPMPQNVMPPPQNGYWNDAYGR